MTTQDAIAHPMADPEPLRAAHTPNFPALLRELGASLLVTTYQAGKLVIVRDEGDHLNTHFRAFQAPMGIGPRWRPAGRRHHRPGREYVNVPAVAARLDRHDACFLPRSCHVTGNIQSHEMAWGAGGELWVVNTRFSCLCTLDRSASFAPRWRPPIISALEAVRRCHLNGLGMVDGRPRLRHRTGRDRRASRLAGEQGPRRRADDVDSGAVITRGLSMPALAAVVRRSPVVCESGAAGTLGVVDPNAGKYEPIRGGAGFHPRAGLRRAIRLRRPVAGAVRVPSSAAFRSPNGWPRTSGTCGVCAIDLTTGDVVALLKFESGVQEVFAVTVLPGRRYPDLINDDETLLENSFVVPTECLDEVAATVHASEPGVTTLTRKSRRPRAAGGC